MMMKSSMNSPAFSLLLLTAHLCLWITPTSSINITQTPTMAVVGDNVKLTVTGIDPLTASLACDWFFGYKVEDTKLISVYDFKSNQPKNIQTSITIDNTCTLTIQALTAERITTYTLFIQYSDKVVTGTRVLNGAERFGMPSIVLLSLAALISSLTLF